MKVAVLAGIGGDLWSYRGLEASVDVLVWRLPEEEFAAIVGVSVNIDSHVFWRLVQLRSEDDNGINGGIAE